MKIEKKLKCPKGFIISGGGVGIKKNGEPDLALIITKTPGICAGAFTQNVVKAHCVTRNENIIGAGKKISAIVCNSGNANACTGEEGERNNREMAGTLAALLHVEEEAVLTASTGVIGVNFDGDIIKKGIGEIFQQASEQEKSAQMAAKAIMTTDTTEKIITATLSIAGKDVIISGMAKGSGMIHPNMATMLSFIMTDVAISETLLRKVVKEIVSETYNMISVDRDTSTNDMALAIANGKAGNPTIDKEDGEYEKFKKGLYAVSEYLAKEIARDGEGATKLIAVEVTGAATKKDAVTLSKSVVTSNLVKAALFGSDANWGRIICALGYSGVRFNPDNVSIGFRSKGIELKLFAKGTPTAFDEDIAKKILLEKEVYIHIDMQEGNGNATAYGCDLSYEYVRINGDYRS